MAKQSVEISEELRAKCNAPGQFGRFDGLFRAVASVPKSEVSKEEAKLKSRKKRMTTKP